MRQVACELHKPAVSRASYLHGPLVIDVDYKEVRFWGRHVAQLPQWGGGAVVVYLRPASCSSLRAALQCWARPWAVP